MRQIFCPHCGEKFGIDEGQQRKVYPSAPEVLDLVQKYKPQPESPVNLLHHNGVKVAVPKVSEYRERFKKRQIRISDIRAKSTKVDMPPAIDSELEKFGDLIVGEGIVLEG